MKTNVQLLVTLTWSKVMALSIISLSFILDLINGGSGTFMFTVPFASSLILGKQYFDKNRNEKA